MAEEQKWKAVSEIFKQYYGVTLNHYKIRLMVEKSMQLLVETDKNIIDIAYIAGFNSLSAFYRHFNKFTGKSPTAYRRDNAKK